VLLTVSLYVAHYGEETAEIEGNNLPIGKYAVAENQLAFFNASIVATIQMRSECHKENHALAMDS